MPEVEKVTKNPKKIGRKKQILPIVFNLNKTLANIKETQIYIFAILMIIFQYFHIIS